MKMNSHASDSSSLLSTHWGICTIIYTSHKRSSDKGPDGHKRLQIHNNKGLYDVRNFICSGKYLYS